MTDAINTPLSYLEHDGNGDKKQNIAYRANLVEGQPTIVFLLFWAITLFARDRWCLVHSAGSRLPSEFSEIHQKYERTSIHRFITTKNGTKHFLFCKSTLMGLDSAHNDFEKAEERRRLSPN